MYVCLFFMTHFWQTNVLHAYYLKYARLRERERETGIIIAQAKMTQ